ncbi:MAG: hypothetical protein QM760_19190 [Nibricoccus sp.]
MVGLTEMTDDGRKIPAPTPENPIYYQSNISGDHTEGEHIASKRKIDPARVEAIVRAALEKAGFKPADAAHPPTQGLFIIWGSHNSLSPTDSDSLSPPPGYWTNVLSRAKVVGGVKFAAEFEKALLDQFNSPVNMGIGNPLYQFTNRDELTRELVAQVYDDCYYIVVTAYDFAGLLKKERKLLWRTKITTSSNGLSLEETLPALVSTSATYLGRDVPTPVVSIKKIDRKGSVTLGTAEVVETVNEKPPESPPKDPEDELAAYAGKITPGWVTTASPVDMPTRL